MKNKGQSALEYLMTYGWALVVIVIVIAALFAFGIFNPPAAGTCSGLDKILYRDHTTAVGGVVSLAVSNGTGGTIDTITVVYGGDFAVLATGTPDVAAPPAGTEFIINSAAVPPAGPAAAGPYSGTIAITYTGSTGLVHTETATCTGSV